MPFLLWFKKVTLRFNNEELCKELWTKVESIRILYMIHIFFIPLLPIWIKKTHYVEIKWRLMEKKKYDSVTDSMISAILSIWILFIVLLIIAQIATYLESQWVQVEKFKIK